MSNIGLMLVLGSILGIITDISSIPQPSALFYGTCKHRIPTTWRLHKT